MKRREFLRKGLALGATALLPGTGFTASSWLPAGKPLMPIWEAALGKHWDVVKEWLCLDPSLINVTGEAMRRYSGLTLLHLASTLTSDVEVLRYLIARGTEVNAVTEDHVTSLHFAVCNNSAEVVKYLISQGADVNMKDDDGCTPLHCAARYGETGLAKILIDSGADLMAKTEIGGTPLHIAVVHGRAEVIKFLIDSGADVNAITVGGKTPLDCADTDEKKRILHEVMART